MMAVDLSTLPMRRIQEFKCREKFFRESEGLHNCFESLSKREGLSTSKPERARARLPLPKYPSTLLMEKRIIYCVGKDPKDSGGSRGEKGHWSM